MSVKCIACVYTIFNARGAFSATCKELRQSRNPRRPPLLHDLPRFALRCPWIDHPQRDSAGSIPVRRIRRIRAMNDCYCYQSRANERSPCPQTSGRGVWQVRLKRVKATVDELCRGCCRVCGAVHAILAIGPRVRRVQTPPEATDRKVLLVKPHVVRKLGIVCCICGKQKIGTICGAPCTRQHKSLCECCCVAAHKCP